MNLHNLRIFVAIIDEGGIIRAADRLCMSQPAVSIALKALEKELGIPLFERGKGRRMKLTAAGEKISPKARQMLQLEEEIKQTAFLENHLLEGTVKIASLPLGTERFLLPALQQFRAQYPNVQVEITEGGAAAVNDMVENHCAEFGISLAPGSTLQSRLLMSDEICALRAPSCELTKARLDDPKQCYYLCEAALDAVQPVLETRRIKNRAQFKVLSGDSVRAMAAAGLGIGLQSRSLLAGMEDRLKLCPVTPEVRTDVMLIARDFEELSPAASAFLQLITV